MTRIVQLCPNYYPNDGVGNHIYHIANCLNEHGIDNIIVCLHYRGSNRGKVALLNDYSPSKDDVIIYHMSIGSECSEFVKNVEVKAKIMCYQNITPSQYFRNNLQLANACSRGRQELKMLSNCIDFAFASSEYSRKELIDLGYKKTAVFPVYFNESDFLSIKPNQAVLKTYDDQMTNFLFVGRVVPNKKIEDVILTYHYYHELINSQSRLFIVGRVEDDILYFLSLKKFIADNDIKNVIFASVVSFDSLVAYYKLASIFLCESEHEGFCIPLLEAMLFKKPVIGYDVSAVPNTMGDAGVLFSEKNHREVARLIDKVLCDEQLKNEIIEKEVSHLTQFSKKVLDQKFMEMIHPFL